MTTHLGAARARERVLQGRCCSCTTRSEHAFIVPSSRHAAAPRGGVGHARGVAGGRRRWRASEGRAFGKSKEVSTTSVVTQHVPVQQVPPKPGGAYKLTLMTVACLAFLGVCFDFRRSLKSFEKTCSDTSSAMQATEKAALEVEKLQIQLQEEIPVTLVAIENASEQVEDFSRELQTITGSASRNFEKNLQKPVQLTIDTTKTVAATTADVIKRAPNDIQYVSSMANVVLAQWRELIGQSLGKVDSLRERVARKDMTENQREANEWITAWRDQAQATTGEGAPQLPRALDGNGAGDGEGGEGRKAKKAMAVNRVAMALSAAEEAAAQAEFASGALQEAVQEYESLSSIDEGYDG